ncbi:hypothetical protein M1K46_14955 [Fictibacillus sp. WQ 8-8]|uniref:Uncharacterized protein n=1 Tax=Fictibacillus marinisediminis TaxID=2878389 RepID=A0A9X2BEC5_9BACL|nr:MULTISPECIES: hypothetical protein [Fictibacillus]MCK6255957.1 hypothetical protein [Fictibacillus marinisediminis]MCQ6266953.1 hypothetical protein [Fictibacillus sp. WQ 8-8]MED2973986.1 hypothetical protein [Fictibacillus sp. B-59209]
MLINLQKEIVHATMKRPPVKNENSHDFFIGYDGQDTPFLLLPTTPGLLLEDECYGISFQRDVCNPYKYHLDTHIVPVDLNNIRMFIDHLAFFFGPDHNMLNIYLESSCYQAYVSWSTKKQEEVIKETLLKYDAVSSLDEKKKYSELLEQLLRN